jgi:DNA repair exonuclease SbcCD ATPase subunit
MAGLWGRDYDREKIESYIRSILEKKEAAQKCDRDIQKITELQRSYKDVQSLIDDRSKTEDRINTLISQSTDLDKEQSKYSIYLRKQMKDYDNLVSAEEGAQAKREQIEIIKKVKEYFENSLDDRAKEYSEKLKEEIQNLINIMLTSERRVSVSPDFFVKVYDSFGDESKSEGQFAIVSFAYIGGILKMLKNEESFKNKEYPLVLDGPFSKLDADQRQNVIDTIPAFAPQVIIFSKDDLQPYFSNEAVGGVYTILSNEEKNVAHVEEGFLWMQ